MEATSNIESNRYVRLRTALRFNFPVARTNGFRRHALTHLEALESESIHILREVAAECRHPVLLFSGGKDSAVLLRLETVSQLGKKI